MRTWTWQDLPDRPPQDELQALLAPLQGLEDLHPDQYDYLNSQLPQFGDDLPGLEQVLMFRPDGLPSWWPLNRAENGGNWSLSERRRVFLLRLNENLPAGFPPTPSRPTELLKLVHSLRHIDSEVVSGVSGILSSS